MNYLFGNIVIKLKTTFSFGGDSVTWLFANILRICTEIFVIFILFEMIPVLQGFSFNECLLIYSVYTVSVSLFYCFFSWTLFYSREYIISGNLIHILSKPVNVFFYISARSFSPAEFLSVILGLLIFVYSAAAAGMSALNALYVLLMAIPGIMMLSGIFLIFASMANKIPKIDESFDSLMSMINYAQYPVNMYPSLIRFVLTWVFPYCLIAYYPASVVLGKFDLGAGLYYLPLYGLILFTAGYYLFKKSLNKYQSTGN